MTFDEGTVRCRKSTVFYSRVIAIYSLCNNYYSLRRNDTTFIKKITIIIETVVLNEEYYFNAFARKINPNDILCDLFGIYVRHTFE
jgi:hypothetical protein